MKLGVEYGKVSLSPHDDSWKEIATDTIRVLEKILGDTAISIQHVGSTSIRGIPAKPIIDIAVGVETPACVYRFEQPLAEAGIHIDFAWRTFIWDSEANQKAHVHCVIVGFSTCHSERQRRIFDGEKIIPASNINGYLIDGENVFVESRQHPLCNVPEIGIGNKPIDGGFYLFKDDEKESLTYAIVGDVVKRTRTIEGDEPCEVEDDFTSPEGMNMTITCNGNVYTEVMEMPLGDASREDVFNTAKQECEFQKENQPDPHELVYNSDYRECQFSKEDDAWKILFATGYREYSDNGKWQRKDDNHWVLRTYFWEDGKIVKVTQENLELDDSEKPSAEKCQETLENKQREAAELGEVVAYYFEEGQTMLDQHCDEAKMVSTYTPDSQIKTKTKDEFFTYMFCDKY